MSELLEHRIKRMKMRSMRRGIKDMDLILPVFADSRLAQMSEAELSIYDALLSENDHDLYQWVTGQVAPPEQFAATIVQIATTLNKLD